MTELCELPLASLKHDAKVQEINETNKIRENRAFPDKRPFSCICSHSDVFNHFLKY